MENLTPFILIAAFSLVIGILLGLLVMSLRNEAPKAKDHQAPPTPQSVEIARIWSDRMTGEVLLQSEGELIRSTEKPNAAQRARLAPLFAMFAQWIEVPRQEAASTTAPSRTSPPAPEAEHEPASQKSMMDRFSDSLRLGPSVSSQPVSIAAQINVILQERLAGSPLESRGIRLMELPGRGMVVMIGLEKYDGVDSVPDPQIRQLLHECVQAWEQESGLE